MKLLRSLSRFVLVLVVCASLVRADWSPRDNGAKGDGVTLDTAAFQKAIDAAHANGGGIVRVTKGVYLIGTLELRTGVTLDLAAESTLLGSPSVADYRRGNWPALIMAKDQERVAITGRGTIDGQGKLVARDTLRIYETGKYVDFFPGIKPGDKIFTGIGTDKNPWIDPYEMQRAGTLRDRVAPRSREDVTTWRMDEFVRPQILEFWHCRNVRVIGITLKNAANWVQTYRECDDVVVEDVHVNSTSYWNNDGMDIVNCHNVRITNCDINAADDGICLKSDPSSTNRACEDVTISHCRIRSSASALKLGTASHNGFRRIRASDLEVYDTYRSVVAIESVDGGVIDDVEVSRVKARNTGNAIFIRIGQRNQDKPPGTVRNIVLSDITVQVPSSRPDQGYEHPGPPIKVPANLIPSSIVGLPNYPIENITLRNIEITYGGDARRSLAEVPLSALGSIPEKRTNYPEFSMFGELPAWGFFLRHAKNIRFEHVTMRFEKPDFRSAFVADDLQGLTLDHVKFLSAGEEPVVVLSAVQGETLNKIEWPAGAREQLRRIDPSLKH
jgi:hypothetical protein